MGGVSGSAYSTTDLLAKAPGSSVDAAARVFRNVFNFADAGVGGTTNPITAARLPRGSTGLAARMQSDQDLSAINFSWGITGTIAKYVAAAAGGAANVMKRFEVKIAILAADPLTGMEEVIITPSANWPAAGTLVTIIEAAKR